MAINRWLMGNPDTTEIPLRERALEIFGTFGSEQDYASPEKALDQIRSGPLLGERERLLRLLCAIATPPPLLSKQPLEEAVPNQLTRVGDGDLLLVVENSATWWSIVRALPAHHNVGHIAWGLGKSFMSSIRSITDNYEIRRIRYYGDVDLSGLDIPNSARRTARERLAARQPRGESLRGVVCDWPEPAGRRQGRERWPRTPTGRVASRRAP